VRKSGQGIISQRISRNSYQGPWPNEQVELTSSPRGHQATLVRSQAAQAASQTSSSARKMDGQKLPEALRHSAVMSAVEPQVRDGREQRAQTLCPTSRTSALRGYERLHERFVLRDVPWAWPWGRDTVAHGPPRPKPTSRSRFRKSCHGLHVLFVRGLHVLFVRSKASRHHTQPMAPRRRFAGQRCRMSVLGDQIEARHDSKSHPSRRRSARKTCVGLAVAAPFNTEARHISARTPA
jgi:hypothetical protein